jgi:hypothetical protein
MSGCSSCYTDPDEFKQKILKEVNVLKEVIVKNKVNLSA